jgi:hypothetical protein
MAAYELCPRYKNCDQSDTIIVSQFFLYGYRAMGLWTILIASRLFTFLNSKCIKNNINDVNTITCFDSIITVLFKF